MTYPLTAAQRRLPRSFGHTVLTIIVLAWMLWTILLNASE